MLHLRPSSSARPKPLPVLHLGAQPAGQASTLDRSPSLTCLGDGHNDAALPDNFFQDRLMEVIKAHQDLVRHTPSTAAGYLGQLVQLMPWLRTVEDVEALAGALALVPRGSSLAAMRQAIDQAIQNLHPWQLRTAPPPSPLESALTQLQQALDPVQAIDARYDAPEFIDRLVQCAGGSAPPPISQLLRELLAPYEVWRRGPLEDVAAEHIPPGLVQGMVRLLAFVQLENSHELLAFVAALSQLPPQHEASAPLLVAILERTLQLFATRAREPSQHTAPADVALDIHQVLSLLRGPATPLAAALPHFDDRLRELQEQYTRSKGSDWQEANSAFLMGVIALMPYVRTREQFEKLTRTADKVRERSPRSQVDYVKAVRQQLLRWATGAPDVVDTQHPGVDPVLNVLRQLRVAPATWAFERKLAKRFTLIWTSEDLRKAIDQMPIQLLLADARSATPIWPDSPAQLPFRHTAGFLNESLSSPGVDRQLLQMLEEQAMAALASDEQALEDIALIEMLMAELGKRSRAEQRAVCDQVCSAFRLPPLPFKASPALVEKLRAAIAERDAAPDSFYASWDLLNRLIGLLPELKTQADLDAFEKLILDTPYEGRPQLGEAIGKLIRSSGLWPDVKPDVPSLTQPTLDFALASLRQRLPPE